MSEAAARTRIRTPRREANAPARYLADRLDLLAAVMVTAAGLALLLFRLGATSLQDFDEATYAEIAREISYFQDWVHLHWNYGPWFNKPPLYIWLTAALFQLGINEFLARLVSALSGAGLILVTYLLGRRYYGWLAGLLAAVILAACYEFVAMARLGQSDELLALFMWLALFAVLLGDEGRPAWWYAAGVFFGLALLSKGIAALVVPISVAIALVLDRRFEVLRNLHAWLGLGLALAIALPWHLAVYLWQGNHFVTQYVGYMVVKRASAQIEGHTGGPAFYLIQMRNQFFPWIYLLPFALVSHVRLLLARRGSWLLLVFPMVVLAL